jgi:hypothetical protein
MTAVAYEPRYNIPLMVAVLANIEANPEDWGQGAWRAIAKDGKKPKVAPTRCGAVLCYAGHAGMMGGARWVVGKSKIASIINSEAHSSTKRAALKRIDEALHLVVPTAEERDDADAQGWIEEIDIGTKSKPEIVKGISVEYRARKLLGLTRDEAEELFDATNDIWRLRKLISEYINTEVSRYYRRAV